MAKRVRIGGSVGNSVTPGGAVVATGFPERNKSSAMPSSHSSTPKPRVRATARALRSESTPPVRAAASRRAMATAARPNRMIRRAQKYNKSLGY